jgi:hypothetical protein
MKWSRDHVLTWGLMRDFDFYMVHLPSNRPIPNEMVQGPCAHLGLNETLTSTCYTCWINQTQINLEVNLTTASPKTKQKCNICIHELWDGQREASTTSMKLFNQGVQVAHQLIGNWKNHFDGQPPEFTACCGPIIVKQPCPLITSWTWQWYIFPNSKR